MDDLDLIGRTIAGKYTIESRVGSGAMGSVFRARHDALQQAVAIKVMHPGVAGEKTFAARFKREAMLTVRLAHPNSIRLFDFGEEPDGLLYLVMEHIGGRDLASVLANEWPLSPSRIVSILRQVLGALSAAHEVGIVHRDLKPENILVVDAEDDEENRTDLVKVCEFGIATLALGRGDQAGGEPRTKLTSGGARVGSPQYMSPEQARGEPTDARSDVYSVGVILYEMLTRRVPYQADDALGVSRRHASSEPERPSQVCPGVDPNLEAICLEALVKDVRRRFQSAREMRAALASVVAAIRAADRRAGERGERAALTDSDRTIAPPSFTPERATFTDEADTGKRTAPPPASERAATVSVPKLKPVVIETRDPIEMAQRRAVTIPRMRQVAAPVAGVDSSTHVVIVPNGQGTPVPAQPAGNAGPTPSRSTSKRAVVAALLLSAAAAATFIATRLTRSPDPIAHASQPPAPPAVATVTTSGVPAAMPFPSIAPTDDRPSAVTPVTPRPLVGHPASRGTVARAAPSQPLAPAAENGNVAPLVAAPSTAPVVASPVVASPAAGAPLGALAAAAPQPAPQAAPPPASFDASNGHASIKVASTDAVLKRDVAAAVARSIGGVTACYQAELRAVAAPRVGSGAVHLDITETGSVRAAHAAIAFGTSTLARCVERTLAGVHIAGVDTGSASADLTVSFEIR